MVTCMKVTSHEWSLSNPGPNTFSVWLEPWCDEFEVPVRSTITLQTPRDADRCGLEEIEWGPDNLVVWATGTTVTVFIDNVLQKSGSAVIRLPDGLTKGMLNIVFADQPAARLGGQSSHAVGPTYWWQRLKGLFSR